MPFHRHQFSQRYQELNTEQRIAVDTIDGPVMVMAGPGTGKTQVLAMRVAAILTKTDTPAQAVLALTFTESAATHLRQRLVQLIGSVGYQVRVATFHSFCSSVIQQRPEYFPLERGSQPLSDIERYQLFEQLLQSTEVSLLQPMNRSLFYLREVMKAISDLKREGRTPADFEQLVEREVAELANQKESLSKTAATKQAKVVGKWQELARLYGQYQRALADHHRYDYDDMIMMVVEAFEQHHEVLLTYQEELHYFLVDEYQDTNAAQNTIAQLLASYWEERANLFVVGDPHQSIFRFQGASAENALAFQAHYPEAVVVQLQQGYRCPQVVYDAAFHLLEKTTPIEVPHLQAARDHEHAQITVTQSPNQAVETLQVAERIKSLLKSGTPADEIAVLFRHNRDVALLQEALDQAEVFYHIDAGNNALEHELLRQVILLLQFLVSLIRGEEIDLLFEVLQLEWLGIEQGVPLKLAWLARQQRKSILATIRAGWEESATHTQKQGISEVDFTAAEQFLSLCTAWVRLDSNNLLVRTLEHIFEQSGLLQWIAKHRLKIEYLLVLGTFFEHVRSLVEHQKSVRLATLVEQVATMLEYGIALPLQDIVAGKNAVTLCTAHRAKGKEWQHVFVLHAYDGKWGNVRKNQLLPLPASINTYEHIDDLKAAANQDERRLFYVAMTRASRQLHFSFPETLIQNGREREVVMSQFLSEVIAAEKLSLEQNSMTPETIAVHTLALLHPAPKVHKAVREQQVFLQSLLQDFQLSVTGLNKYLEDPEFFLEQILLKVPRTQSDQMAFGSAMHSTLEYWAKQVVQGEAKPSLKQLTARFTSALNQALLTNEQLERRRAFGVDILQQYYQSVEIDPAKVLFVERFFGGAKHPLYLDDIPLIGRIDRVDWLDQAKSQVTVIDYKTGKPKSANVIEGMVASQPLSDRERALPVPIRGRLKRQLLFYKLLAELDPGFKPIVTEGVFSFVEPSQSGKLVERRFALLDEDVALLKVLIKEVMAEVRGLAFTSNSQG